MKGDFTRDTFHPEKHYQRVLQQQGRVQLDADWNEQTAIDLRRDSTTTSDIVGRCGGPAEQAAFGLTRNGSDIELSPGRYYVDGFQCEIHPNSPVSYLNQPHRLAPEALAGGRSLIYLDVWQRHITALEDGGLREPALGGVDTTTRAQLIWQVRAQPDVADCAGGETFLDGLQRANLPQLLARTEIVQTDPDPCVLPATAGFRGLENQLYRIEIHEGGANPTFKWSRDNGSVVAAVREFTQNATGTTLKLSSLGRDQVLGFQDGQIIELIDDSRELEQLPGALAIIAGRPDGESIRLGQFSGRPLPAPSNFSSPRNLKVRRWEGVEPVPVVTPADANEFITLESGVQIRFDSAASGYQAGDYWLIPARAASADALSGDIEWPRQLDAQGKPRNDAPIAQAPRGIVHHYCRLGVIDMGTGAVEDCRCLWPSLTTLRLFYVSGDGQEVMPVPGQAGRFQLPRPLVVGVANAHSTSVVRFTISAGNGRIVSGSQNSAGPNAQINVPVGANGLAECTFSLDGSNYSQQVTAELLDADCGGVMLPIIFNANLSIASEVAYDPGECAGLSGQVTVQQAIAQLARMASLYKISGDAQSGFPGQPLSLPIVVLASSDCGSVPGVTVQFEVKSGGGTVSPTQANTAAQEDTTLGVPVGGAFTIWTLGPQLGLQELEARIISTDRPLSEPVRVRFTATAGERGLARIIDVRLRRDLNRAFANDFTVALNELAFNDDGDVRPNGLIIFSDTPIDENSVLDPVAIDGTRLFTRGKPTCFITVEVPFPLIGNDFEFWGVNALAGYWPLILNGRVSLEPRGEEDPNGTAQRIIWEPVGGSLQFLQSVLDRIRGANTRPDRLLLRLTLKGNFIRSLDEKLEIAGYLDGESFHNIARPGFDVPTGDDHRGGDFHFWFWLSVGEVAQPPKITIVSPPGGKLTIPMNSGGEVRFTIEGEATLPVTAVSSAVNIIPNGNLIITNAGAEQILQIRPAQNTAGQANVTISVDGPGGKDSKIISVTVTAPNITVPGGGGIGDIIFQPDPPPFIFRPIRRIQ